MQFILYLFLLHLVHALEIYGQFRYCLLNSNLRMLNSLCDDEENHDFDIHSNFNQSIPIKRSAFVFSKHKFILETIGYECTMIIYNVKFGRDIFFSKYIEKTSHFGKLTKADCQTMLKDKKCGNAESSYPLICMANGNCDFKPNFTGVYPLFGSLQQSFIGCSLTKRVILAQSLNSSIFSNSIGNCFAEDEVCFLATSTIIWSRNDIRKCLFERLTDLNDLVIFNNQNKTLVYSDTAKLLFNLKEKIDDCGLNFHKTSEGLYLSFYMEKYSKSKEALLSLKTSGNKLTHFLDTDRQDFLLSESDFTQFKILRKLNDNHCRNIKNIIFSNMDRQDTFLQIVNKRNDNIQLYINDGKVFLPTCVIVRKIYIQERENFQVCSRYPQVTFDSPYSSIKIQGFIRFNNILTQQDHIKKDCSMHKTSMIVEGNNQKFFLIKINGSIQTADEYTPHLVDLKINNGNLNNYFEHHSLLFNGSDFFEQINEILDPLKIVRTEEISDENTNNQINLSAKEKFLKNIMDINYDLYRVSLESIFKSSMRRSSWVYGDKLLKKFARQNQIDLEIRLILEEREQTNGYLVTCSALQLNVSYWSGSEEVATRIASWKWLKKLFGRSGARQELYWRCVKKFAKEVIEIDDQCIFCDEQIGLESLWEHVRNCVQNEQDKWRDHESAKCPFCNSYICLNDFSNHTEICKKMNCTSCGLSILKTEEATHKEICQSDVTELESCQFCNEMIECTPKIYTAHVRQCKQANQNRNAHSSAEDNCKICGGQDTHGHQCTRCPICLLDKPVANWIILDCLHYICNECSPIYFANDYEAFLDDPTEDGQYVAKCPVCREEVRPNGLRIFL
ncbi:hypothetical protein BpHYR1_009679 [Brachionus plicatilis]|uniref:RING-type domain-containing protein n=1 Tax=Brachionus plicatilis TaxID=10195 RepID=A0A3M7T8U6_BRAPC|nr:hypothetical protein BpHYR1_009679 [Brachionus plicatilis]